MDALSLTPDHQSPSPSPSNGAKGTRQERLVCSWNVHEPMIVTVTHQNDMHNNHSHPRRIPGNLFPRKLDSQLFRNNLCYVWPYPCITISIFRINTYIRISILQCRLRRINVFRFRCLRLTPHPSPIWKRLDPVRNVVKRYWKPIRLKLQNMFHAWRHTYHNPATDCSTGNWTKNTQQQKIRRRAGVLREISTIFTIW